MRSELKVVMRPATRLFALAELAALVLLAPACGGSASPSVAAISTTTSRTGARQYGSVSASSSGPTSGGMSGNSAAPQSGNDVGRLAFAVANGSVRQMTFAACMRAHGLPNLPDPNTQGQIPMSAVTAGGIDPRSRQLGRAAQACTKDLPKTSAAPSPAQRKQQNQHALAFSACMRSHSAPNFPDPPLSGAIRILPGSGIDPQSPRYKSATMACRKYLGGKS
jgi:hypothetical protein